MITIVLVTTGQIAFYGGIAGIGISFVAMLLTFGISERKKRNMLKDMEREE